jgi:protein ImuB
VNVVDPLVAVAREFSPRFERHRDGLVSIDVSGLGRLIGPPRAIGEELRRDAAARGMHVHVAVAATRSAALVLAIARPGLTVVDPGRERETLAPMPISVLERITHQPQSTDSGRGTVLRPCPTEDSAFSAISAVNVFKGWGVRTLGELAALPSGELSSRLGQNALTWQAMARGEDRTPLVPTVSGERFEGSLDLEWPIDGLEPLSFVLTRLLEPLSERLERRDRGAATLHLDLRLITPSALRPGVEAVRHARHLQLPSPIRDVRTLRTLLLLDLDAHPPPAAVDRVTIVIDPTPGRVVQHTLFTRAHPTPERLSTLLARLSALMGQDRIGAPATVDSYRPGAFAMEPFATEHGHHDDERRDRRARRETYSKSSASSASSAFDRVEPPAPSPQSLASALRRCRHPVPARAVLAHGRPTRVTTDRRGFAGGAVRMAAGPWRTSGDWWAGGAGEPPPFLPSWDRDEWDVALADGAVYRVFQDRETGGWFIDAIVD